ncbi:MAG: valine--tRNA ligase [Actinobacteria bacterium]|nr:valine--tRNA ligase [Actinomycetota bacterium]
MEKLENKYTPSEFESDIYKWWLEKDLFHADISDSKKPFSIVIPPPNVTGYLHIGHALNNTLQDILIRYARMKGYSACWIPGTDHAGIATQNVVEKELNKNGITRFELGREKFIEKVWEWKEQYGSRIISQLKSLGCSCDWERLRFTFDDEYVKAVNHEFVTLYNSGLIYRGNYMVNWCPRCLTAISDIEVEHKEKKGNLWDIKYPLIDEKTNKASKDEFITVSTTRPETMLGDAAVAVNPADSRYSKFVGRMVMLPLMDRAIPVIADNYVDMKFGTGALKITPSHDPNDFELASRHNLEKIDVMTDKGTMNDNAGAYKGLDRYKARAEIIKDLKELGLLANIREHVSSLGTCSRCDTVIEPRVSNQWFVSMKKLAEPAVKAVKDGKIKFIPKKWEKLYFNWMENIRDWCISRQLWWGHRIPVWYCNDCSRMIVSETAPLKCGCGSSSLRQDSDVLDTWFSSCLWPFASMGWPKETAELKYFFPTSVLVTAHDIIFFWVARMIMMSLYFMKEIPFKEVFINPLVNDIYGQKMSKSKGNVIDPLSIIDKSGTDILRFTLASLTTPGKNLLLGNEKIEGSRNFANKIWNASKFAVSAIKANQKMIELKTIAENTKPAPPADKDLGLWDRWIISRLIKTSKSVQRYIERYSISLACRTLVNFFWNDFCDWYIESVKVRIYSKENEQNGMGPDAEKEKYTAVFILWYVLEKYLRLLHPFMPFMTEKIWQCIPHEGESIMVAEFAETDKNFSISIDNEAEKRLSSIFDIISEIRKTRSELKISPSVKVKVYIAAKDNDTEEIIKDNLQYIKELAKISSLVTAAPDDKEGYLKSVRDGNQIYIYLRDVIDTGSEIKRISSDILKINADIEKYTRKISNPQFMEKAPPEIIKKEKSKLARSVNELKVLQEQLDFIKSIGKL